MTVASTPRKAGPFAGNGVTTAFPFDFKVFDKTDIQAIYTPLTGNAVGWFLDSDYSITLNSNQDSNPGGTLTVITPPPLGTSLAMIGALVAEQATDITNAGRFLPQVVEDSLDKLTILVQQLLEVSGRTLQAAVGSTLSLVFPAPSAGKFLRWRTDLLGLENAEGGTDSLVLQGLLADSVVSTRGSAMVGYDGATVQSLLDGAKTLTNYTAMRAYAGRATSIRPTASLIAGQFYRDVADATSADDGGTVIVDALARRWKRTETDTLNVKWFGAVGDGVTDDTAAVQAAATRAAAQGKGVRFPAGTFLVGALTLPAGLAAFSGKGKRATVLKFKRIAYAALTSLIDARNNTAGIELSSFGIDCDDVLFKTAPVRPINLSGSNGSRVRGVRILGRGDAAIYADGVSDVLVDDATIDCTGSGGASFVAGLYMTNGLDVTARGLRITGLPNFGAGFALGCSRCHFEECHIDGTASGFGIWFDGANRSSIRGCTAKNTYAEAFQITNGSYNLIAHNSAEWDNTHGMEIAISVHAEAGFGANFNRVVNNNLTNSYFAGLVCANNAAYNVFECNTLRQCGVRGTAANPGGNNFTMGQYTDISGAQCTTNIFRNNKVIIEGGNVSYGYAEFVGGGGGAAVVLTRVWENEFHTAGGSITTRYVMAAPSSFIADLDWITFVPTVAATTGSLGSAVANSAKFRRRGEATEITMDITITAAGSGAGPLTVLWPGAPNAGTNGGTLCGTETTSRKAVVGAANAGGVVLTFADGTTPIATGARIVVSGTYRTV